MPIFQKLVNASTNRIMIFNNAKMLRIPEDAATSIWDGLLHFPGHSGCGTWVAVTGQNQCGHRDILILQLMFV